MSIVGRGLGRRGVAAALIVTAGLGLGSLANVTVSTGGRSYRIPPDIRAILRRQVIDEDDLLLLLAVCIDGNSLH